MGRIEAAVVLYAGPHRPVSPSAAIKLMQRVRETGSFPAWPPSKLRVAGSSPAPVASASEAAARGPVTRAGLPLNPYLSPS
jgi:hypothetical protein